MLPTRYRKHEGALTPWLLLSSLLSVLLLLLLNTQITDLLHPKVSGLNGEKAEKGTYLNGGKTKVPFFITILSPWRSLVMT